jgi:dTDP-4-dehydrorhamnose 3,5-epimerase
MAGRIFQFYLMEISTTNISGLIVLQPKVFYDERGYFFESFREDKIREAGISVEFVQENESRSQKGVLRGMHFQNPPYEQGKLVRVVQGSVLDVVIDIRKDAPTYGKHYSIELSAENKTMFWIPAGFAHGFLALEDDTIFQYKCTNYYNKASEGSLQWNDPDLKINWGDISPLISSKDIQAPLFKNFISQF